MYIYIYMYICIYVYMYIYIYICIYVYIPGLQSINVKREASLLLIIESVWLPRRWARTKILVFPDSSPLEQSGCANPYKRNSELVLATRVELA